MRAFLLAPILFLSCTIVTTTALVPSDQDLITNLEQRVVQECSEKPYRSMQLYRFAGGCKAYLESFDTVTMREARLIMLAFDMSEFDAEDLTVLMPVTHFLLSLDHYHPDAILHPDHVRTLIRTLEIIQLYCPLT